MYNGEVLGKTKKKKKERKEEEEAKTQDHEIITVRRK